MTDKTAAEQAYVPTTEEVRKRYALGYCGGAYDETFDRWLAAHDEQQAKRIEQQAAIIEKLGPPRGEVTVEWGILWPGGVKFSVAQPEYTARRDAATLGAPLVTRTVYRTPWVEVTQTGGQETEPVWHKLPPLSPLPAEGSENDA